MKRIDVLYLGNVQGVGFRFTAEDLAKKYSLKGWVKNLADSRVQVVAEGEEEKLSIFLAELSREMSSHIREEKVSWEPGTGEFKKFQIRF
jgi:acylphosphatase